MRAFLVVATIVALVSPLALAAQSTPLSSLSILYPKHESSVGKRVNVVLDPATDWSAVPFFQVRVGGTTYPLIDTASGRHALQGVALVPGMNTITVSAFSPASKGSEKKTGYQVLATRTLAVYSRDGGYTAIPPSFVDRFFHAPDQEAECAGCHRLEVGPEDRVYDKPDTVLCYSCHREMTTGKYIHGPAAVWNCLACHDPDQRPVRYQFGRSDPWQIARSTAPVSPAVFTLSGGSLFAPGSATLLSDVVSPRAKDRRDEVRRRKEQERALFQAALAHLRQNPGERVLVEAHVDTDPLPKGGRFRNHQQLTEARARVLEKLLRSYGITEKGRITVKGMGSVLPKVPGTTAQDRQLNDRIELVAYPPDVTVSNSKRLPSLADREQVSVTISHAGGGAPLRDLTVIERLPAGAVYVRGTGIVRGTGREPRSTGSELVWSFGNPASTFQERITYTIKRTGKGAGTASTLTQVRFTEKNQVQVRDFDPMRPISVGMTVEKTCASCHGSMVAGPISHGPAAAGYCTICHDPHASNFPAWTRTQSWLLCTTCHAEKRSDVHLIRGAGREVSHPTRKRKDPLRPGKALTCISCHSPHSAESQELLVLEARDKFDLCRACHPKKF